MSYISAILIPHQQVFYGHTGHPNKDRQLPGIPPEITQMFAKLMAPLTKAASLLPLGRQLPALPGNVGTHLNGRILLTNLQGGPNELYSGN